MYSIVAFLSFTNITSKFKQTISSNLFQRIDMDSDNTSKLLSYLTEAEALAQDILTEKELKLELSNAANKYNEAIRALEKTESRKTWLKVGSVYVELPVEECKDILKEEKERTRGIVDDLYVKIKEKVGKLRDLEHDRDIKSFNLKPLTSAEAGVIHKAMGFNIR